MSKIHLIKGEFKEKLDLLFAPVRLALKIILQRQNLNIIRPIQLSRHLRDNLFFILSALIGYACVPNFFLRKDLRSKEKMLLVSRR